MEQGWPVVPGGKGPGYCQPELSEDVALRRAVGGGGQRHNRHPWKALFEDRELLVLPAEIMSPLRDAMRLVDGEQGEASVRQPLQATRGHQPRRRDIEPIQGRVPNTTLRPAAHA